MRKTGVIIVLGVLLLLIGLKTSVCSDATSPDGEFVSKYIGIFDMFHGNGNGKLPVTNDGKYTGLWEYSGKMPEGQTFCGYYLDGLPRGLWTLRTSEGTPITVASYFADKTYSRFHFYPDGMPRSYERGVIAIASESLLHKSKYSKTWDYEGNLIGQYFVGDLSGFHWYGCAFNATELEFKIRGKTSDLVELRCRVPDCHTAQLAMYHLDRSGVFKAKRVLSFTMQLDGTVVQTRAMSYGSFPEDAFDISIRPISPEKEAETRPQSYNYIFEQAKENANAKPRRWRYAVFVTETFGPGYRDLPIHILTASEKNN